jgi:hypothetical protein
MNDFSLVSRICPDTCQTVLIHRAAPGFAFFRIPSSGKALSEVPLFGQLDGLCFRRTLYTTVFSNFLSDPF